MSSRPHILILYTGGTIGMRRTPHGYEPVPGHLQHLIASNPCFRAEGLPAYTWNDRGDLLGDGTQEYAWDAAGRLVDWNLKLCYLCPPKFDRYQFSAII